MRCHKPQNITVFIKHGHICRVRIGKLFHFGNGCLGAAAKIADTNLRCLIRVHAYALSHQRHIPALHVGSLSLCFRADTAFLVYNGISDSIKQLVLRPGKFRLFIFFHHCLIGGIVPQVRRRAVVSFAAGQREHIRQMTLAFVVHETGELVAESNFVIVLLLDHGQITAFRRICQQELRYSVIIRILGSNSLTCGAILVVSEFLVDLSYVRIGFCLRILHQLLICCVVCQIFAGRNVVSAVCPGKLLPDTFLCAEQGKLLLSLVFVIFRRCQHILICRILRQIRFSTAVICIFGLQVRITFLMRELILNIGFIARAGILHYHIVLVLRQVLSCAAVSLSRTRFGELLPQ